MRLIDADALEDTLGCSDEDIIFKYQLREAPTVTNLTPSDIADLRNELCLKCGQYHNEHLGACNGCRWKKGE